MNNNLKMFENKNVEVFEFEGKVLFNPKHVAECLDIANVNDSLRKMNEKQVIKLTNSKIGNTDFRKLHNTGENFLTESGVYKLIFKSRKAEAEKFQDWVTDEVLPELRQKGVATIKDNRVNDNVASLVQNTMTAILPVITEQMAKVVIETKEAVNNMAGLLHDQSEMYDADRENLKDLIGFRSVNTTRMCNTVKEKLNEKLGKRIRATDREYLKVKKEIFKEFEVIKWEDIPVEKYNSVFAFVDTYIDEEM